MLSKSSIKYIQSLQHKKFRDLNGVFLVEGSKLVLDMLTSGTFEPVKIYAIDSWRENLKNKNLLSFVEHVTDAELERISAMPSPNKVCGIFKMKVSEKPPKPVGLTLVLDDIKDPGNLGTIIRTADWFGVKHIICSRNTVEIYNPKVVQSTMGSLSNVNVYYTSIEDYLEQNKNITCYAAVLGGESIRSIPKEKTQIVIIGNEANGIRSEVLKKCSKTVGILGSGSVESLNAAIATAILLYEFSAK